jgi:hypothetical protein
MRTSPGPPQAVQRPLCPKTTTCCYSCQRQHQLPPRALNTTRKGRWKVHRRQPLPIDADRDPRPANPREARRRCIHTLWMYRQNQTAASAGHGKVHTKEAFALQLDHRRKVAPTAEETTRRRALQRQNLSIERGNTATRPCEMPFHSLGCPLTLNEENALPFHFKS